MIMQKMFLKIVAIAFLLHLAAYGQSLGEIARENREKQNAEDTSSAAKPKVITNKDLPQDLNANTAPREAQTATSAPANSKIAADRSADIHFERQRVAEQRAAEQWKRQILTQKHKVQMLQARVDQLNAAIRSVGGSVQYDGPANRNQAQQMQRVVQIHQQLDEQKWKLDQMQESARHAGMHTAVYDP
jgi:predicted RNase H-like nuclease (RuvC/YqgF family)